MVEKNYMKFNQLLINSNKITYALLYAYIELFFIEELNSVEHRSIKGIFK